MSHHRLIILMTMLYLKHLLRLMLLIVLQHRRLFLLLILLTVVVVTDQWEIISLALLVTVHVVRTLDHLLGTLTTMPMAARIQLRLTDALMHKAISGKRRLCLLFSQHLSTRLAFLTRTGKP